MLDPLDYDIGPGKLGICKRANPRKQIGSMSVSSDDTRRAITCGTTDQVSPAANGVTFEHVPPEPVLFRPKRLRAVAAFSPPRSSHASTRYVNLARSKRPQSR